MTDTRLAYHDGRHHHLFFVEGWQRMYEQETKRVQVHLIPSWITFCHSHSLFTLHKQGEQEKTDPYLLEPPLKEYVKNKSILLPSYDLHPLRPSLLCVRIYPAVSRNRTTEHLVGWSCPSPPPQWYLEPEGVMDLSAFLFTWIVSGTGTNQHQYKKKLVGVVCFVERTEKRERETKARKDGKGSGAFTNPVDWPRILSFSEEENNMTGSPVFVTLSVHAAARRNMLAYFFFFLRPHMLECLFRKAQN